MLEIEWRLIDWTGDYAICYHPKDPSLPTLIGIDVPCCVAEVYREVRQRDLSMENELDRICRSFTYYLIHELAHYANKGNEISDTEEWREVLNNVAWL